MPSLEEHMERPKVDAWWSSEINSYSKGFRYRSFYTFEKDI